MSVNRQLAFDSKYFYSYAYCMAGRPPKPPDERRANVLRILLTDAERDALNKLATSKGLDTSTWARTILLELLPSLPKRRRKS